MLVEVLTLRASSWIGKPGIDPKGMTSPKSTAGEYGVLCGISRPYSVGISECAGVNDTRGGAVWGGAEIRGFGRSEVVVLDEKLDPDCAVV